ncbi:Hisn3 [Porphyridium purpureum]|uniref:1-(5-phosphoribosyl)-5-[(5-phosphoribosylamino)methylideneamino]imidazole-4-carboxamideisomerase n=1 Tax=Porphyridium purpureum TaxID=35688 RepID=A0A5J4YJ75_PORPP|nr:Hisn3 [Porphyridium purpureum]|eukprot:POR9094..scf251_18
MAYVHVGTRLLLDGHGVVRRRGEACCSAVNRAQVSESGSRRASAPRVMRFRPCIDLHGGKVKQIVGGTLTDERGARPTTNFETELPPSHYAQMYCDDALPGGHVIMLGPGNEDAAIDALRAFPNGMHVGGGISPENAARYLDAGASHVIVTSYVFRDGQLDRSRLKQMVAAVGRERLVLDLSCKQRDGDYYVCTDRWQKWTSMKLCRDTFDDLAESCDEFLVHAAHVEGLRAGMDLGLVELLAEACPIDITYAGGARSLEDLDAVRVLARGRVDLTIGSALDIFGGQVKYSDAVAWQRAQELQAQE